MNVYGFVSVGLCGCERKFSICTEEEWDELTPEQQDEVIYERLHDVLELWTEVSE